MDGVEMEQDLNRYDLFHVTAPHAQMSKRELAEIYRKAWDLYYTPKHVETVLRRAKTWGYDPRNMMWKLLSFHAPPLLENVHPLEGGIVRRKRLGDRRSGLPLESPFVYYPRESWRFIAKHIRFGRMYWAYRRILKSVLADNSPYADIASAPVALKDFDDLELYRHARGSQPYVDKVRRRMSGRAIKVERSEV
jgi:hypothetical protein